MGHNSGRRQAEQAEREQASRMSAENAAEATAAVEAFNARLMAKAIAWTVPTVGAALAANHPWLMIVCDACGLVNALDLRMKRRPFDASVLSAVNDVRCPRCNGHGRPRLIALARFAT